MYTISCHKWPDAVTTRRGTILDAALANDVSVPYQCRSGQCGTCKCRLLIGAVEHDDYLPSALSERERAEGWVLACRARPKSNVEIDYGGEPEETTQSFQCREAVVARRELLTHDIVRLVLALDGGPFRFKAGQYVQLHFDGLPPRSYSMANLPGAAELEFYIREMPNGKVSCHVARSLAVGDTVRLEGPCGQSFLRTDSAGPILAAAGGSGLAPILAIAREAARTQPQREFHLYFGVRSAQDVFAQQELADLAALNPNLCTHIVLSEANDHVNGYRTGMVHEAVAADFKDLSEMQVYAAGPPPMVEAVTQVVAMRGVHPSNVYSDPFTSTETGPASAEIGPAQGIAKLLNAASLYSRALQQEPKPANSDVFVRDCTTGAHPNNASLTIAKDGTAQSIAKLVNAASLYSHALQQEPKPANSDAFVRDCTTGAHPNNVSSISSMTTETGTAEDISGLVKAASVYARKLQQGPKPASQRAYRAAAVVGLMVATGAAAAFYSLERSAVNALEVDRVNAVQVADLPSVAAEPGVISDLPSLQTASDQETTSKVSRDNVVQVANLPFLGLRVGDHPGFSRLVFDWPISTAYRIDQAQQWVTVNFDTPAQLDFSHFRSHGLLMNVAGLTTEASSNGLTVVLTTSADAGVRHFVHGTHVVVDVLHDGDPGKLVASHAPEESAAAPAIRASASLGDSADEENSTSKEQTTENRTLGHGGLLSGRQRKPKGTLLNSRS